MTRRKQSRTTERRPSLHGVYGEGGERRAREEEESRERETVDRQSPLSCRVIPPHDSRLRTTDTEVDYSTVTAAADAEGEAQSRGKKERKEKSHVNVGTKR